MYEYVSDGERLEILHARESKRHLSIGEGGEGFIGQDDWCYNCGAMGHWGDVRVPLTLITIRVFD